MGSIWLIVHFRPSCLGYTLSACEVSPPRDVFHRSTNCGKSSIPHASSLVTLSSLQSLEDSYETDEDEYGEEIDDDYVFVSKETHVPEETTVPDVDAAPSCVNITLEPQSTKVPSDYHSSIASRSC